MFSIQSGTVEKYGLKKVSITILEDEDMDGKGHELALIGQIITDKIRNLIRVNLLNPCESVVQVNNEKR